MLMKHQKPVVRVWLHMCDMVPPDGVNDAFTPQSQATSMQ